MYAVTGSRSGMGRAVVERLQAAGHRVVTVDLAEAEVVADLSTLEGRQQAAYDVLRICEDRLDGAVLAAGVGPIPGRDQPRLICQLNYLGVVDLLTAWRPALAASGSSKAVAFASNSTTTTPVVPGKAIRALLAGEPDAALRVLRRYRGAAPAMAYAASKTALSHWVRREAVTRAWAGSGIRLNALAPGAVMTPLLERQLATPGQAKLINGFPVPVGGYGNAGQLADWVVFMLSPAADFLCGSVVFVDGGTDAYLRPDAWPRTVPLRGLPAYLRRIRSFRARA